MDQDEMRQMAALGAVKDSSSDIRYRSEALRATEKIIDDEVVEDKLEGFPLWVTGTKTLKLTFLDERNEGILQSLFEAEVCKMMRSMPPSMMNSDLFLKIGQARMVFIANTRRSVGTNNRNQMNERIVLQSQFKQIVTDTGTPSKSIFSKLFGR